MSSFVSRLAVTAAGLPIVLGAAWLGGWALLVLLAIASLVALHELYTVARALRPLTLAGYAGAVAALVGVELGGLPWLLGGVLTTLPLAFVLVVFAETRQSATVTVSFTLLGPLWVAVGLGHAVLVRGIPEHGRLAIFTVLLTVFAADTGAYLVGRLVGRHKLAPAISPGKSWEGLLAGAIAGVFVSFVAVYDTGFLTIWESLVLGLVVVVASVLGDLLESLVKRDIGVKDTGRLLAGHGGVLDRIDSLLFALPAAFYTLLALGAA
jgi:phosphatidate cytidylyltransferase